MWDMERVQREQRERMWREADRAMSALWRRMEDDDTVMDKLIIQEGE